jgi:hypothetical protein
MVPSRRARAFVRLVSPAFHARALRPAVRVAALAAAAALAACGDTPRPADPPAAPAPAPATPQEQVIGPVPAETGSARISAATTARAYRKDGASHLYGLNADRIYQGKLPPLIQAVGVLQVHLDAGGRVRRLEWMRAPRHVPKVMAEIERTVRAAAPFPAPARMGGVVYTDTWLWDKSGKFQLDTLTEGQR